MHKDDHKSSLVVDERYGVRVYQTNPSIPSAQEIKRDKRTQIGNDHKGLVVNSGNGEILGHGVAVAYEWEEVDKERFVKALPCRSKTSGGVVKSRACCI